MSCQTCEQDPCTCQKSPTKTPHLWIIQHCIRPGCSSAIPSHDGLPESELICKWCRAKDEQSCAYAVYPNHAPHTSESVLPSPNPSEKGNTPAT
jgi:hypothetical protein